MGVLDDSDVQALIGYFLGAFGLGFTVGAILRIFRRGAEKSIS